MRSLECQNIEISNFFVPVTSLTWMSNWDFSILGTKGETWRCGRTHFQFLVIPTSAMIGKGKVEIACRKALLMVVSKTMKPQSIVVHSNHSH